MAYVAVNKSGQEVMFNLYPTREDGYFWYTYRNPDGRIFLPKGTIKKIIGKDLTWEDNPVELRDE